MGGHRTHKLEPSLSHRVTELEERHGLNCIFYSVTGLRCVLRSARSTLFPRVYRYENELNPNGSSHTPQASKDRWSKLCCQTLTLTSAWRDSLLSNIMPSLWYMWHMGPRPCPRPAIMKTHLRCKLICNYDLGKSSKETQKGLIESPFPMCLSPDKWDKMLSDVRWLALALDSGGEAVAVSGGPGRWHRRCGDKNSTDKHRLFVFAKLRWEILPLRRVHCQGRDRKTNLTTTKIKCHMFSQVGVSRTQSERG